MGTLRPFRYRSASFQPATARTAARFPASGLEDGDQRLAVAIDDLVEVLGDLGPRPVGDDLGMGKRSGGRWHRPTGRSSHPLGDRINSRHRISERADHVRSPASGSVAQGASDRSTKATSTLTA